MRKIGEQLQTVHSQQVTIEQLPAGVNRQKTTRCGHNLLQALNVSQS